MSKFWQKKYTSKYTGAEIDAAVAKAGDATKVTANPTLAGTEAALTGLEVGETKYKLEQPINVVANPTLAGTEAALTGLQVGDTKYAIPAGGLPEDFLFVKITGEDPNYTKTSTYSDILNHLLSGKPVMIQFGYEIYINAGAGNIFDPDFNPVDPLIFEYVTLTALSSLKGMIQSHELLLYANDTVGFSVSVGYIDYGTAPTP